MNLIVIYEFWKVENYFGELIMHFEFILKFVKMV